MSDLVVNPEDRFSHNEAQFGTASQSLAEQVGLCRTWSETPNTGFLTTRINFELLASL